MNEKDKAKEKEIERMYNLAIVLMAALFVAFCVWLGWKEHRRPVEERAAWNEGYYGVDASTALAMAENGIGKTSEDVIAEVGK